MKPLSALLAAEAQGLSGLLFDLDDTLLTHGKLTLEAYSALHALDAGGLALVGLTGRPCGWAEVVARQWPVRGCVAENGAIAVVTLPDGVRIVDPCAPAERAARSERLAALAARVRELVPEALPTDDARARRTDLTWDIGEQQRLPDDRVQAVIRVVEDAGARWSRSSIHLHATYDGDDKASGALRFCAEVLGVEQGAAVHRFAFAGDSGNDAPAFAAFATTFGVANVRRYAGGLSVPPRYVAALAMGAGFAEIAKRILDLRAAPRAADPPPVC